MSSLVEKIHLIKSDPEKNNNKFWIGELYDDNTVITRWGRVGDVGQSKTYSGKGKSFLDSKVRSKKRAGRNGEIAYREIEIIDDSVPNKSSGVKVINSKVKLKEVAKKQIKYNDPETPKMIEYLTEQNIHDICSYTDKNITYNYETGAFVTPLGAISLDSIKEAREILDRSAILVKNRDFGGELMNHTRDLLMIVPQNIGRQRIELESWWNDQRIKDQNTLLDGLEASLRKSISKPKNNQHSEEAEEVEEKVFDTTMELVTDKKLQNLIFGYYNNTRSNMHTSVYRLKPIKLWKVSIANMDEAFKQDGKKMKNIVPGFHGSGTANTLSLLKSGMLIRPPKNAHVAGALFGSGIYSAPIQRVGSKNLIHGASTKAANYCTSFWGGRSSSRIFLFVVEMAMGDFYVPKSRNYMSINYPVKGYDSTWAYGGESGVRNDEAIVYRSSQVNIRYLMELQ